TTPDATPASATTVAPADPSTTAPGESTTTVAGESTTTSSSVPLSDPAQSQVLPTNDGAQCYVGPAGGDGTVFEHDAQATVIPGAGWGVTVTLRGGDSGEGVWNQLAAECHGQQQTCPSGQLAIELDGVVISHPTMQQSSYTGGVQISGSFKQSEAKNLARVLR